MKVVLVLILALPLLFGFKSNEPNEPNEPNELINIIHSQIEQGKRLIAFGETHQHKSLHALLERTLTSKHIQEDIDVIIVEFGNSFYQDLLDRYINGENVSIDAIRVVWRNTLISPNTVWDSPVYERFFKTIRDINKSLQSKKRYRVIAAGKSIDWATIHSKEDMIPLEKTTRTEQIYEVVGNEVFVKNKTAILIAGGWHTTQLNLELNNRSGYSFLDHSAGKQLNLYYPNTSFFINSYSKLTSLGITEIENMKIGSTILTSKNWLRNIDGDKLVFMKGRGGRPDYNPYRDSQLKDMADALIYWGPKEHWVYERPLKETYQDEVYWKELNRRSMIKRDRPMDKSLQK